MSEEVEIPFKKKFFFKYQLQPIINVLYILLDL